MTYLSSPFAERYRQFFLLSLVAVTISLVVYYSLRMKASFSGLLPLAHVVVFSYILLKRTQLLKEVSYDQEFLYIKEKKQEEVIPLTAIKNVELKTMGGRWKVNFHPAYTSREKVTFLPSLLYPMNYKKVEKRIDVFHQAIAIARKNSSNTICANPGLASSSSGV